MATTLANTLGRDIGTLFSVGVTATMSDERLLELFLNGRGDEAEDAFAAVVDRHGPMVWRICRRALVDPNDAEDAFQVTFLVLARKARSIAHRGLLANWLYGVAVRSAKDVKATRDRRRIHEQIYRGMITRAHDSHADDDDAILAILDSELARLPEVFRAAVVLCDLEGLTHEQAARALGVPAGTIASRLSRGRERLRQRLKRRGFTGSMTSLAAATARDFGVLSPSLVARTAGLAELSATGRTATLAVPSTLRSLTAGVIRSMLLARITAMSLSILLILGLAVGAASALAVARRPSGADDERSAGAAPGPGASRGDDLAWIDSLANADAATKTRLKRCLSSAVANFATIRRANYDFEFRQEVAALDNDGEPTSISVRNYHGNTYWREGSVRYRFVGPPPLPRIDEQGRLLPSNQDDWEFTVIRQPKLLVFIEEVTRRQRVARAMPRPATTKIWRDRYPAQLTQLDPLVFYAKSFRTDESSFRAHCESLRSIQSAEGDRTIVLRFRRSDDARIEIICDKSADCLPTRYRIGRDHQGTWQTWTEESCEWQRTDDVWFPTHQVAGGYIGKSHKPLKVFDLTIQNARFNDHCEATAGLFRPESVRPDLDPGVKTE